MAPLLHYENINLLRHFIEKEVLFQRSFSGYMFLSSIPVESGKRILTTSHILD
jgi:hypothetical protein